MASLQIPLYGPKPSLDHRAGPRTAMVEVRRGFFRGYVDPERDRVRLEDVRGSAADHWFSGASLLLVARLGWWGCKILEDGLRPPPAPEPRPDLEKPRRRPHLPRDLASCAGCGAVVILRRDRKGKGFRLVSPSRDLLPRIRSLFRKLDVPAELARFRSRATRAGKPHGVECTALGFFRPIKPAAATIPGKRGRGRPRSDPKPYVPLPWKIKRSP